MDDYLDEYGYKYMEAWQDGMNFSTNVINYIEKVRPHVKDSFLLSKTEQLAVEIPSKIAFGRSSGIGRHYLEIVREVAGTIHMMITCLHLIRRLKWISATDLRDLEQQGLILATKLCSLERVISRMLNNGNE